MIVVNCDASIEGGNPGGHLVAGWIARHNGEIITAGTIDFGVKPGNTNNIGEFTAVLGALHDLLDFSRDLPLVVKSDSKLVIEQLNNNWACNNGVLRQIRDKIWQVCDQYNADIKFTWVPRSDNMDADLVSRSIYK